MKTYGDHVLSETTCRDWFRFRRFKNNDFDVEDKERSGAIYCECDFQKPSQYKLSLIIFRCQKSQFLYVLRGNRIALLMWVAITWQCSIMNHWRLKNMHFILIRINVNIVYLSSNYKLDNEWFLFYGFVLLHIFFGLD